MVLRRKSWICPKCGKPLVLCEPTVFDLPKRMGESSNKIQFYYACKFRLLNITNKPRSMFTLPHDYGYFDGKHIKPTGSWIPRGNDCFITTIPYTKNRLDKDKLFFVNREILFLCRNCRQKLSVNHNPFGILRYTCFLLGLTAMVIAFVLIAVVLGNAWIMQFMLFFMKILISVVLLVGVTSLAFSILYYFYIKLNISNFVPTDEFDNLIYPQTNIVLSNDIKSVFLHEGNVFLSKIDGEDFYIYLIHKKPFLAFSVCGIEGRQERLLTLIREKQTRGESVFLTLYFEGKLVGNAEILETYDPVNSSAKEGE